MNPLRELKFGAMTVAMRSLVRGLALTGDPVATVLGRRSLADPYPYYEAIRARGEATRHRTGLRLVTGHGCVKELLRDPRMRVEPAVDHVGVDWNIEPADSDRLVHPMEHSLLVLNPPDHTRLRRLVSPWFTPAAVRGYGPRITTIVDAILDTVACRPEFDLAADFAEIVPMAVVLDLFAIPDGDRRRFQRWGSVLGGTLDGIRTLAERRAVRRTLDEMTTFFDALLARRRGRGGTDVLSRLADAEVDGVPAAGRDVIALAGLLLVAGFETTVNLIGSAAVRLLDDPHLRQLHVRHSLPDDPAMVTGLVEETLRHEPPVQFTLRKTGEPLAVAGHELPTGTMVVLLLAAANRDPAVFADPARFDPLRPNAREHLAFSAGIHYCVGAGLARLETEIAVRRLLTRLPGLRLAGDVRYKRTRNIRGCSAIPVSNLPRPATLITRPAPAVTADP